jgi:micrococcal nuclease
MGWLIYTSACAGRNSLLVTMAASLTRSDNRMSPRLAWTRRLAVASGFLALAAVASPAGAQQWAPASGQVTRAIDGESIEVKLADRLEIVRYAGISTPELHHPTRGIDFYRRAAMAANAKIVADKRVLLTFDVEPRDRHGRLLAYVYAGNVFVNAELAGAGYAEVVTMPPNVQHRDVLMARQREARQANRGLWGDAEALLYHRPRPSGVFGNTRLQIYFHPDDSARMILLADPFLHFESPQHAAAAGYRPSMDYATFVRREQKILSGEPLSVTTGGQFAGSSGGTVSSRPRSHDTIYLGGDDATIYSSKPPVLVVEPPAPYVVPRPSPGYNPPSSGYIRGGEAYSPYQYPTR